MTSSLPKEGGKEDEDGFIGFPETHPEVKRARALIKKKRINTGIDYTRPPIYDLKEIFDVITNRALENGLRSFLDHMGSRKLRVVTMCSGTESPILALEMVANSLKTRHNIDFEFEHMFSVEIVPFKQAYIERNFYPPCIFRDVRELCNEEATTAYGGKAKVPGDPDLLVAGFSCVDFSALNNKRKDLDDLGESGQTFQGILRYIKRHRPPIIILENVRNAPWSEIETHFNDIKYHFQLKKVDTKNFYLPQTRERGYAICVDGTLADICNQVSFAQEILGNWSDIFGKLGEQASAPFTKFILEDDDPLLDMVEKEAAQRSNSNRSTMGWEMYQIRHELHRRQNKLGEGRPLTHFQDNGTCSMPPFVRQEWVKQQPERVWDTLDINYLRSLRNYDINYKSRVIDLSQGVDREIDNREFGIVGCITPCGMQYVTTRGGIISGLESLALQGLPLDRLLLSKETSRELQDLAGNAMSSTVVGSAMLAALISSRFSLLPATGIVSSKHEAPEAQSEPNLRYCSEPLYPARYERNISVMEFYRSARASAKFCPCERNLLVNAGDILQCHKCLLTACTNCAGSYYHNFVAYQPDSEICLSPLTFIDLIRQGLPLCLRVSGISTKDYEGVKKMSKSLFSKSAWENFLSVILPAYGEELKFTYIRRASFNVECWNIIYVGKHSVLRLALTPGGIEWQLYVKPPSAMPSSSVLFEILQRPIARMRSSSSSICDLLSGVWEICLPISSKTTFYLKGKETQLDGFASRCGLQDPESSSRHVWSHIDITSSDAAVEDLEMDIRGVYELLIQCEAAEGALHRRIFPESESLFLFLDPQKLRSSDTDSYVISRTHTRINGNFRRDIIVEFDSSFREFQVTSQYMPVDSYFRKWVPCSNSSLVGLDLPKSLSGRALKTSEGVSMDAELCTDANTAVLMVSMSSVNFDLPWARGPWRILNLEDNPSLLDGYSWLLQKFSKLNSHNGWIPVSLGNKNVGCEVCEPKKPRMIAYKGSKGHSKIYEDPTEASIYEQRMKAKPVPFLAFSRVDDAGIGHLCITLNVQSLLHQAHSKLRNIAHTGDIQLYWRLMTASPNLDVFVPPPFSISNNASCAPSCQPPSFSRYKLRLDQLRSLTWMISREAHHVESFPEEEIEESILDRMSWRAEAKAVRNTVVRGGVIADHVGYGKTAVILGLIDMQSRQRVHHENGNRPGLIPIKATLIIVPNLIHGQWQKEIHKFLGSKYRVLVVKSLQLLHKYTVSEIKEFDIILLPWSLIGTLSYFKRLEQFSGGPTVPDRLGGRLFDEWLIQAVETTRMHIDILKSDKPSPLLEAVKRKQALTRNFNASCLQPSRRRSGNILVGRDETEQESYNQPDPLTSEAAGQESSETERDASMPCPGEGIILQERSPGNKEHSVSDKIRQESSPEFKDTFELERISEQFLHQRDLDSIKNVPLHVFEFNRLIVDEFTYLDPVKTSAICRLSAYSKWFLSGTPPINDFSGVSFMASLFGVHIGVENDDSRAMRGRRSDSSDAEIFQSFRKTKSAAWHANRHIVAQKFLNQFIRRNVAGIGEIPSIEHIIALDPSALESILYEELLLHLKSYQFEIRIRRHTVSGVHEDGNERINRFIQHCANAAEALLKRAAILDIAPSKKDMSQILASLGDLVKVREKYLEESIEGFGEQILKALHECRIWIAPDEYFLTFLGDIRRSVFLEDNIIGEIESVLALRTNPLVAPSSRDFIPALQMKGRNGGDEMNCLRTRGFDDSHEALKASSVYQKYLKRGTNNGDENLAKKVRISNVESMPSHTAVYSTDTRTIDEVCNVQKSEINRDETIMGHDRYLRAMTSKLRRHFASLERQQKALEEVKSICLMRGEDSECEKSPGNASANCGTKLTELIRLLQDETRIGKNERAILFIQYDEILKATIHALKQARIGHVAIGSKDRKTQEKLDSFVSSRGIQKAIDQVENKVLILVIGGENAAGLNLQCANHVIFLSPLHVQTQFKWEADMTQAIGRIRRYGQLNHIHIWHILIIGTVDVDLLQMRRNEILVETKSGFEFVKRGSEGEIYREDLGRHSADIEVLFGRPVA